MFGLSRRCAGAADAGLCSVTTTAGAVRREGGTPPGPDEVTGGGAGTSLGRGSTGLDRTGVATGRVLPDTAAVAVGGATR